MTIKNVGLVFFAIGLASGCASRQLVVESSTPNTRVVLLGNEGSGREELGSAPVTLKGSDLSAREANVLALEAPGHHTRYLILPKVPAGETQVRVTLEKVDDAWFLKQLRGGFAGALGEALGDLLELNASILSRDAAAVRRWSEVNGARYESVAAYHLLLGHHHLVEGRLEEASKAYRKVLALEPKNEDALSALSRLSPK